MMLLDQRRSTVPAAPECVVVPASALDMDLLRSKVTFLRKHMVIIRFLTTLRMESTTLPGFANLKAS
jgi:hypothetical protein